MKTDKKHEELKENIKCDISFCNNEASCYVRWGVHDSQQGNLCYEHIKEVWEMSHRASVSGIWIQKPINKN